jgi:hypothetical protein
VGGSQASYIASRLVAVRPSGPSVVPTSFSQESRVNVRVSAEVVATLFAAAWGGIDSEFHRYRGGREDGRLLLANLGRAPLRRGLAGFHEWRESIEQDPDFIEVQRAWTKADIVVFGVAPFANKYLYPRDRAVLEALGLTVKALRAQGAIGLAVRRVIDRFGAVVTLDPAKKIVSSEVAIPFEQLRRVAANRSGNPGASILVFRGEGGAAAASVVRAKLANFIICDRDGAEHFVRAWGQLQRG